MNIQLGDTVSYTNEDTFAKIYGKVEKIVDCIEETFVVVDDWWININLVQKQVA